MTINQANFIWITALPIEGDMEIKVIIILKLVPIKQGVDSPEQRILKANRGRSWRRYQQYMLSDRGRFLTNLVRPQINHKAIFSTPPQIHQPILVLDIWIQQELKVKTEEYKIKIPQGC